MAVSPSVALLIGRALVNRPLNGYDAWLVLGLYSFTLFPLPLWIVSFIAVIVYLKKQHPQGKAQLLSYIALVVLSPLLIFPLIMLLGFLLPRIR
jgi:hypothetical protein